MSVAEEVQGSFRVPWWHSLKATLGPALVAGAEALVDHLVNQIDESTASRCERSIHERSQFDRDADLLGVTLSANASEIRAAFRRKAAAGAHPDHGGSNERMQALTSARDRLLQACAP